MRPDRAGQPQRGVLQNAGMNGQENQEVGADLSVSEEEMKELAPMRP